MPLVWLILVKARLRFLLIGRGWTLFKVVLIGRNPFRSYDEVSVIVEIKDHVIEGN